MTPGQKHQTYTKLKNDHDGSPIRAWARDSQPRRTVCSNCKHPPRRGSWAADGSP